LQSCKISTVCVWGGYLWEEGEVKKEMKMREYG
jgi:hypothetical protein